MCSRQQGSDGADRPSSATDHADRKASDNVGDHDTSTRPEQSGGESSDSQQAKPPAKKPAGTTLSTIERLHSRGQRPANPPYHV